MESPLSWDDLRLVLVLSREGSLLGAGRILGVNASTVSRRLESLEERLGVQIFDRTRQGVKRTQVVEQMLPFAEAAEQAAAGFARAAEGFERDVEGLVRLSAPPGVASLLLGHFVSHCVRAYPRLQIQIDAEVGYVDLSLRESDIAIRGHRPAHGDLLAVKWVESDMGIVASPSMVEEIGEVSTMEELSSLQWINWGPMLSHLPSSTWISANVPDARVVLSSDAIEVNVRSCAAGAGVMVMSPALGSLGGLRPLRLSPSLSSSLSPFPMGALWLVCHRALRRVPRIAAVWEALLEQVRDVALEGELPGSS